MTGAVLFPFEIVHGDAATSLNARPARSVDMIYTDPPFGNRQVWTGTAGRFDDRWSVTPVSDAGWQGLQAHNPACLPLFEAICHSDHDRGYLGFIAGLLIAARRVLKLTGTLWIHFDDTFGAEIRMLGEAVFGLRSPVGVVIWKRTAAHNWGHRYGRVHDTIAVFARSPAARWRLWRCKQRDGLVRGDPFDAREPVRIDGLCDAVLGAAAKERRGYPTQKPEALLRQFIRAATLPSDLVADPTCGSGTTLAAALGLGRRALGIDVSAEAVALTRSRLSAWDDPVQVAAQ